MGCKTYAKIDDKRKALPSSASALTKAISEMVCFGNFRREFVGEAFLANFGGRLSAFAATVRKAAALGKVFGVRHGAWN